MREKNYITIFTLLIYVLLLSIPTGYAFGQDITEVRAIQMFHEGKFREAENAFARLLIEHPENPLLNYYYGASRTENGFFGENELDYLTFAGENFTPERLHYYLGMQHHARGNWKQALKFYNQFRMSVPVTEQQELELDKKIEQCFNQVNPYEVLMADATVATAYEGMITPAIKQGEQQLRNTGEAEERNSLEAQEFEQNLADILAEAEIPGSLVPGELAVLPDLPGVPAVLTLPPGDAVTFMINPSITYVHTSQFHTEQGRKFFESGKSFQDKLDKDLAEIEAARQAYVKADAPEIKAALADKILSLEMDLLYLQSKIEENYTASRKVENEYWEKAGSSERSVFFAEQEKILEVLQAIAAENNQPVQDEIPLFEEIEKVHTEFLPATVSPPADTKDAGELVYKIQIGAYSRGIPSNRQKLFNKLSVIRKIENYTDEKGIVVYTTGNLKSYDDAVRMQNQVKQEGIQDAVVAPYFNGKRIPLEQAKNIEAKK